MTTTVNADLFRIVAPFISTEEARFYLRGVFIQPHQANGVYLVATDGHRLMVAHDEEGATDAPVIVRLDKATLAACNTPRNDVDRTLEVDAGNTARVLSGERKPLVSQYDAVVDGTFPDWRRIASPSFTEIGASTFNPDYLADFAKAAKELAKRQDTSSKGGLMVAGGSREPCLVRFLGIDYAYGVLMPIRSDTKATVPLFLNAERAELADAA